MSQGLSTPPERAPSVPSPPPHPYAFDPGTSPFSFQAPTKYPRTWAAAAAGGGPCKGSGGGWGGFDGSAVDFSWMPLSNGRGLRGTRWSSAGGRGGHRRTGCFKPSQDRDPPPTPPFYFKADPPLGHFVRQPCNR